VHNEFVPKGRTVYKEFYLEVFKVFARIDKEEKV
jgi:hypothetical protein